MNMRARIGLLVEAQGAKRASSELSGVAHQVDRVGNEAAQSGRKMRRARADANSWRSGLRSLSGVLKIGAAAAVGYRAVAFGKGAIDEYRESVKASRATANAIRSSGHAANVTSKQVGNLANSLSLKAGIDDEAIQGSENLLLTFRKVRNEAGKNNDIFNQATKTALDMSAAYGVDLRGATIQLGKALQDPVKGAAALKRVGAIDQTDIDKLKEMAKAHHSLGEQQRYVLDAINKAGVKGRAAAIADPFDKAKTAWNNFKEAIGYGIAPYLKRALVPITAFVQGVTRMFARKDLSFSEKLRVSFEAAKRMFTPFLSDMWNKIKAADIPGKLSHGFDVALPFIVNHIAAAAPRAAAMFARAFVNMGPWAKLLTAAWFLHKLGFMRSAGATAAKNMIGGIMTGPWGVAGVALAGIFFLAFDKKARKFASDFAKEVKDAWSIGTDVGNQIIVPGSGGVPFDRKPGPHGWQLTPPSQPGSKGGGGVNNPDKPNTRNSLGGRTVGIQIPVTLGDGRVIATATHRIALRDLVKNSTA